MQNLGRKRGEKWHESLEAEYWEGCDIRHQNLANLVRERNGHLSLRAMLEILHNHAPFPACICLHGQGIACQSEPVWQEISEE